MTENLRDLCKQLRLAYVAEVVDSVEFSTPQDYLSNVLVKEIEMREFAKLERNLKKARFLETKRRKAINGDLRCGCLKR